MKQLILIMVVFSNILSCDGQTNTNNQNTIDKMRTFDIKKFEENRGKGKNYNDPHIYDYETKDDLYIVQSKYEQDDYYSEEVSKKFSPYVFRYTYSLLGFIETEIKEFNNSIVYSKEYDKNSKHIKETNFDKNFKHTFEQIHDMIFKEKKVDIYDTRQAIALRHDTSFGSTGIKKYYQIHVLKSELLDGEWYSQPNYSFIIDDETGRIISK